MQRNIKIIKYVTYLFLFTLVLAYGTYQFRGVVWGPEITITSPKSGELLATGRIKVQGQSSEISSLYLNGRRIFTDASGEFSENVLLLEGYNIIEVKAIDKMNRSAVRQLQIVYKSGDSVARVEEVARLTRSQL